MEWLARAALFAHARLILGRLTSEEGPLSPLEKEQLEGVKELVVKAKKCHAYLNKSAEFSSLVETSEGLSLFGLVNGAMLDIGPRSAIEDEFEWLLATLEKAITEHKDVKEDYGRLDQFFAASRCRCNREWTRAQRREEGVSGLVAVSG